MVDRSDIGWFKRQFQARLEARLAGSPFSVDFLTALASQETGEVWPLLRRAGLEESRILELCVGDTLDEDRGRKAFPRNKAALLAAPGGGRMFELARRALEEMASLVPAYAGAARNPDKFCHGFGIFQYDLQFFLGTPDYFLERRYADFDACVDHCLSELRSAAQRAGLANRAALTDLELVAVGIAYNTGRYNPAKGIKQGYFDGQRTYGECLLDYLKLARSVTAEDGPDAPLTAAPSPLRAQGPVFEVKVEDQPLRLRSTAEIDPADPGHNIIARLPDGLLVRALTEVAQNGFLEVETSLRGALLHGFAATRFLKARPDLDFVAVAPPAETAPTSGVVAVHQPNPQARPIRRGDAASAFSLIEPGQPLRRGSSAVARRADIAAILAWLAVDDPAHRRYQPREGQTFCNVYAHDYCHLADVYLPRVWWTANAIERLGRGEAVEPRYGNSIVEMRANALFDWLRDFGARFGWRQTGTLDKLQLEVNQGAVGLIIAQRTDTDRPGHVTLVVPETAEHSARRDRAGAVLMPLQSQAGSTNFRYATPSSPWWTNARFGDSGFWLHA